MGMQAPKQVPRLCSTIAFPSGLVQSLGAGPVVDGYREDRVFGGEKISNII